MHFSNVEKQLSVAEETILARMKSKQNKQENMALLSRIRLYQQIFMAFDTLVPVNERQNLTTDKKWQPHVIAGKTALKSLLAQMQNSKETVKLGRQPLDGNDG